MKLVKEALHIKSPNNKKTNNAIPEIAEYCDLQLVAEQKVNDAFDHYDAYLYYDPFAFIQWGGYHVFHLILYNYKNNLIIYNQCSPYLTFTDVFFAKNYLEYKLADDIGGFHNFRNSEKNLLVNLILDIRKSNPMPDNAKKITIL
jgi:hypothetical protein